MLIRRKSVLTGIVRSRDIPVNPDDFAMYEKDLMSLSEAMPYLEPDDREFILAGITKEEWVEAFNNEIQKIVSDNFQGAFA